MSEKPLQARQVESRTHQKNRATPKSHKSRKKEHKMKKIHFFSIAISTLFLIIFSTEAISQQRTQTGIILKLGNYHAAWEIPGGGFGRCFCGQGAYDCPCGFVNYTDFEAPNIPVGQIVIVVSSQVVSGNTLQINFKEKLKMKLKRNDFVQEEAVLIISDVAKSLGYKSITILPGTYKIKDNISIAFNIEKGEVFKTRG